MSNTIREQVIEIIRRIERMARPGVTLALDIEANQIVDLITKAVEDERNNPQSESNVRCATRLSNADQKHTVELAKAVHEAREKDLDRIEEAWKTTPEQDMFAYRDNKVWKELQAIRSELGGTNE